MKSRCLSFVIELHLLLLNLVYFVATIQKWCKLFAIEMLWSSTKQQSFVLNNFLNRNHEEKVNNYKNANIRWRKYSKCLRFNSKIIFNPIHESHWNRSTFGGFFKFVLTKGVQSILNRKNWKVLLYYRRIFTNKMVVRISYGLNCLALDYVCAHFKVDG